MMTAAPSSALRGCCVSNTAMWYGYYDRAESEKAVIAKRAASSTQSEYSWILAQRPEDKRRLGIVQAL
jgi:hypothetical protein